MENNYLTYENNTLMLDGVSVESLATQYGTPLYLMSEGFLRERMNMVKTEFLDCYDNVGVIYASKAFSIQKIYTMIQSYGIGADVCSDGEIYTALKAGFDMKQIYFHGSNKTWEEIEFALKAGVGTIMVDNLDEIVRISTVARGLNKIQDVIVRIVPGIKAGATAKIQTGTIGQKFGISTHDGTYLKALQECIDDPNLNLKGIHCHIGSQIKELERYRETATQMMKFVEKIKKELNYVVEVLDVGGGFGIEYANSKESLSFKETVDAVMEIIETESKRLDILRPKVIFEPGRFLVGPAGVTVYTVTGIKEIKDVKTFIHVDGGMTDNIRPSLYGAKYDVLPVQKNNGDEKVVSIAGHGCETGDVLAEDIKLEAVENDDYLVFLQTGAYNYSMASNYNSMRKPAVVFTCEGEAKLVVKRQTYQQLLENEIVD